MNKTLLKSSTFLLSIPTRFVSYVPRFVTFLIFKNLFIRKSLLFFRKRNYYEVLGIEKSATLDKIKQAFAVESRKVCLNNNLNVDNGIVCFSCILIQEVLQLQVHIIQQKNLWS